jgi:hypothetical protein
MMQSIRTDETDRDVRPTMTELVDFEIQAITGGADGCGYAILNALLNPYNPAAAAGVSICFV